MRPSERRHRELYGSPADTSIEHHTRGSTGMSSSHGGHRAHGGAGMEPRYMREEIEGYNRGRGPREYERSDERIYEEVCEALTAHDSIDATDVRVSVQDRVVTLEGSVDSRWVSHLAEDLADQVLGVEDVFNRLLISY